MPEIKASPEIQNNKKDEEAFIFEKEFYIDKTTIFALISIFIALLILAQMISPAPIWAFIVITILLFSLLWIIIILINLINDKKISVNDIIKIGKLFFIQSPKGEVFPPIKPQPYQRSEPQVQSEQLYTDYIFTEEGWKSASVTCAICKKPYADLKHTCGAIYHRPCLDQYFSSLPEFDQETQLCPHCYEPLYQKKQEEMMENRKSSNLPEEEIEGEVDKKGFEIFEDGIIDKKIDLNILEEEKQETIIDKIDTNIKDNEKEMTISQKIDPKSQEKEKEVSITDKVDSKILEIEDKENTFEEFEHNSLNIQKDENIKNKIGQDILDMEKEDTIINKIDIDWSEAKTEDRTESNSLEFDDGETIFDKLGIDWLDENKDEKRIKQEEDN